MPPLVVDDVGDSGRVVAAAASGEEVYGPLLGRIERVAVAAGDVDVGGEFIARRCPAHVHAWSNVFPKGLGGLERDPSIKSGLRRK